MKVAIGSKWRRAWFETRDRNGTYEALNSCMCDDALDLQRAMLGDGVLADRKFWGSWLLYGSALVLAVGAFALLVE